MKKIQTLKSAEIEQWSWKVLGKCQLSNCVLNVLFMLWLPQWVPV